MTMCPPGRRDWDYVAFPDYQADMKESTDRAVAVISEMRRRAENAERVLAEVVLAAGGRVSIHDHVVHDLRRNVELTIWRNEANRTLEFEARRALGETASDKSCNAEQRGNADA